jgi:hypothetical protein
MNLCLQLLYIMSRSPPEIYSWPWPNRLATVLKSLIKYDTVSTKIAIMTNPFSEWWKYDKLLYIPYNQWTCSYNYYTLWADPHKKYIYDHGLTDWQQADNPIQPYINIEQHVSAINHFINSAW